MNDRNVDSVPCKPAIAMEHSSQNSSRSMKNIVFGGFFIALLMLSAFPPFYLKVSGSGFLIFGIPLAISYWVIITVTLGIGVTILYAVEVNDDEMMDEVQS
ncbi:MULTISPECIES: hypothetical protein [unclassified Burkholderia]|uniref:hypothetical protein n=1 Tax=unclassified Burkholderia TaxID=2613784 RepID=UPI002AB0B84A|nr:MULTISPECIES: hypothetical protein [unclassified Burkholderia]